MGRRAQALSCTRARSLRQGMPMQRGRAETDLSSIVLVLLGALLASCSPERQPDAQWVCCRGSAPGQFFKP